MKFTLGDERIEFASTVRRALADGCSPTVVRAAWDGTLDRDVWATLVDMGTTDPDLDFVTRVAVAEEIGRAALPHPWVETAFVAAPVVGPEIGSDLVSTDLGTPGHVPGGAVVDRILLADRPGLRLVAPADLSLTPVDTVDRSRLLQAVDRTASPTGAAVDAPHGAADPWLAGVLGTAAVLIGLGQHLLDATVDYVGQRHQFGQPVGGFQAVKHHLADAAKDLTFARPIVARAAYGLDTAPGDIATARDVSMAKALAGDAATRTAEAALQCHGAIGYTVEHDLHLWLKRVWALARAWGDADHHRGTVGDLLDLG